MHYNDEDTDMLPRRQLTIEKIQVIKGLNQNEAVDSPYQMPTGKYELTKTDYVFKDVDTEAEGNIIPAESTTYIFRVTVSKNRLYETPLRSRNTYKWKTY